MSKPPKRPRDPNQLAKMIVDLSTGQVEEARSEDAPTKQALGGRRRAVVLTEKQRTEISRKAAAVR